VTLSRNGGHARSTVFSRLDLGLPPLGSATDGDRVRAQLLTGAAAFVLVHLSTVHPQLQKGLYHALNWKSVTLQVIATSASLIDEPEQRTALLARAVNEDPAYPLARIEYLWALQSAFPIGSPAYRQFTDALEREITSLPEGTPLLVRALYRSTAQRINLHAHDGFPEEDANLLKAARSAERLDIEYRALRDHDDRLSVFVAQVERMVTATQEHVAALLQREMGSPAGLKESLVPRVVYENACQAAFLVHHGHASPADALHHLRYALPTERDRMEAREDPCLDDLHGEREFQKLVREPPTTFLDLPVFAPVRHLLVAAGLNSPAELVLLTGSEEKCGELAKYLGRPPVMIDRYRRLAQLAEIHVALSDPTMLQLLLDQGIASPGQLRDEVHRDGTALADRIKQEADTGGLTHRPAEVDDPSGWLAAARSLRLPND